MSTWSTINLKDGEVVAENDPSHRDMDQEEKSMKYSSHLTWMMCTVYELILIMVGIVTITSAALNKHSELVKYYVEISSLYMNTVSLAFLLYVHCYLLRQKHSNVPTPDHATSPDGTTGGSAGKACDIWEHRNSTTSVDPPKPEHSNSIPAIVFCNGVNFYLRLGAIAFCIGFMILLGFSLASTIGNWTHLNTEILTLTGRIERMVFLFFQTYFIFTSHGAMINKHKVFVRFGLKHMIATNLCVWFYILITETSHSFSELTERYGHKSNVTVTHATGAEVSAGIHNETNPIKKIAQLVTVASPYLYPCAIEYSLIAVTILHKIFDNVGKYQVKKCEKFESSSLRPARSNHGSLGIFFGILVVVISLISLSVYFILKENLDYTFISIVLFYSTEIFVLFLALIGSIVGILQLHQLKIFPSEDTVVDSRALLVSFFIANLYSCFLAISSISNIVKYSWSAILQLTAGGLALLQTVCQTVFLIDGLSRCVGSENQAYTQPGRGAVRFLLLCNLSLWIFYTFEEKKVQTFPMHSAFYGTLPWAFILHGCIPMIIFYRFHSTVCLATISTTAYKKHKLN